MKLNNIHKVGAVILKNKKILALKKRNHDLLITPGGKIHENESAVECLKREIIEEINCTLNSYVYLNTYSAPSSDNIDINLIMDVYLVSIDGEPHPSNEITDCVWLSYAETFQYPIASILGTMIIPLLREKNLI